MPFATAFTAIALVGRKPQDRLSFCASSGGMGIRAERPGDELAGIDEIWEALVPESSRISSIWKHYEDVE
jgi:hypothetical protein